MLTGTMYDHGLIGNCQASALIGRNGSVDWLCLPRPDSPPVFGRLLDPEGGHFSIEPAAPIAREEQRYLPNTNVLVTRVELRDGDSYQITDFFPRFEQHGRMYRPMALFRIVEPLQGTPALRVRFRPVDGWEKKPCRPVRGNSHLRCEIRGEELRLATNMSLTHLYEETSFPLSEKTYLTLTWGVGIEAELAQTSEQFLERTCDYWKLWVKHCSIPTLYQKETIRSALTLKLHCYEDTGAILAALTTSLPEERGHERNWDYRFCWLRDAYYVLSALHNLGHFEEMEGFLKFFLGIAYRHEHSRERLRPVYALDQSLPLPETQHPAWKGFAGSLPVRSNNQAAEHVQNDVYGEMILALSPIFQDERFHHLRTPDHEQMLGHLAGFCARKISEPDAGLWEIRDGWREHSFSNLMCWAGLDRVCRIQDLGFLKDAPTDFREARLAAQKAIDASALRGILPNGPGDDTLDASLLQLPMLRYPNEALNRGTVDAIARQLALPNSANPAHSAYLYRYMRHDDFGKPGSAFLICSFWLVQALAKVGEIERARDVMAEITKAGNHVGLFAEHYDPVERQQFGNFPQAYSHCGAINAAFAISPPWDQVL